MQSRSNIGVFGCRNGMELRGKGFIVTILSKLVLATLIKSLGLGLKDNLGRTKRVLLIDEIVLIYGFCIERKLPYW